MCLSASVMAGDVDRNRPIDALVVAEIATQRLDVAVEYQADRLAVAADDR